MERLSIDVVENATKTVNIMPATPLDKVVADCMTDYLEMRKAEEQGLLKRFPCKVGTKVYLTNHDRTVRKERPLICNVDEFTMQGNDCYAVLNANEPFYALHRFKAVNIKDFGKTVFLTREEAEQALEAMKGGVEC